MIYLVVDKNCSEFSCSQLVLHKLKGECAHLCRRRGSAQYVAPSSGIITLLAAIARRGAAAATTTLLYRYHLPFSPFAWLGATRCACARLAAAARASLTCWCIILVCFN